MNYVSVLKNVWASVYDPNLDLTEIMDKFFHKNYEQCINGVVLQRAEYIEHVRMQRQNVRIDRIDYVHVLEKGDELFALYYPRGKNNDNFSVEAEVIAYFQFKEAKIFRIHGQVRLLQGNFVDVDMEHS